MILEKERVMKKNQVVNLAIGSTCAAVVAGIGYAFYKKKKAKKVSEEFEKEVLVEREEPIELFDNVHYIPLDPQDASIREEHTKKR